MKKTLIVLVAAASVLFSSCEFLDSVASTVASIANLANCEYSMKNVSNVNVAGVNLKNVTNGNISLTDVASLTAAIVKKSVPLNMDVNVNVKNPTDRSALLSTMDWALDIAEKEFVNGTTTKSHNILANNTTTVPLGVNTDIYSLFSKIGPLKEFASSFRNDGTSSQLGLRIRPSLAVGGQTIKSPSYISVMKAGKSVTSKASNSTVSGTNTSSTNTSSSTGSSVGRKRS